MIILFIVNEAYAGLKILKRLNLKLHLEKCMKYTTEVHCCGRKISADVVRLEPTKLEGLENMSTAQTDGQFKLFVCALQWLKHRLPAFATLISLVLRILQNIYHKTGKGSKRAVSCLDLSELRRSNEETNFFLRCKEELKKRVNLLIEVIRRDSQSTLTKATLTGP